MANQLKWPNRLISHLPQHSIPLLYYWIEAPLDAIAAAKKFSDKLGHCPKTNPERTPCYPNKAYCEVD